jgi:hypothetical protein
MHDRASMQCSGGHNKQHGGFSIFIVTENMPGGGFVS